MGDQSYELFYSLLLGLEKENGRVPSKQELAKLCGISVKEAQEVLSDVKADVEREAKKRKLEKETPVAEDQDETVPMDATMDDESEDIEEALEKEYEKNNSCPSGPASSVVPTAAVPTSKECGSTPAAETVEPVKPAARVQMTKTESAEFDKETVIPTATPKRAKSESAETLPDVKDDAGGSLDKRRCP